MVASDTGAGASVLLSDPALGLRGRPDYLLEEETCGDRILVPLEINPTRRSQRLYESDAVQVGQTASSTAPAAITRLDTITSGLRRPVRSDHIPPPTAVATAPAA